MAEYIEREALDRFRDEVMDEFIKLCCGNDYNKLTLLKIGDTIDSIYEKHSTQPAADVVDVVRCKDCEYWENGKDYEPYCNHFGNMMTDTKADDYCSYGVRKGEGE